MKTEDSLKEILGNVNQQYEPVELERSIMENIIQYELEVQTIKKLRKRGNSTIYISIILIIFLAFTLSIQTNFKSPEGSIITLLSSITALVLLFIQLQFSNFKIFNKIK